MTGIAAARILLLTLLLAGGDARVVTVDAAKNDLPIDVSQKAVPVKLEVGDYFLRVDGRLWFGTAPDMRPACEALVNVDPAAVRMQVGEGDYTPVAVASIATFGGLELHVVKPTTAYLFLTDSDLKGNSGEVVVSVERHVGEDNKLVGKYRVDAVRNCYALDLPNKAVAVKLEPGEWVFTLKRAALRYADHPAAPGEQPQHVLLDCNPARVGTSWDEKGDTPVGTWVLNREDDAVELIVSKPTTVRLYLTHSTARHYAGQVQVTIGPSIK